MLNITSIKLVLSLPKYSVGLARIMLIPRTREKHCVTKSFLPILNSFLIQMHRNLRAHTRT